MLPEEGAYERSLDVAHGRRLVIYNQAFPMESGWRPSAGEWVRGAGREAGDGGNQ